MADKKDYIGRLSFKPVTAADYEYLYDLHVASMKPYVEQTDLGVG